MDSPSSYRTNRDLFSNHYLDEHLPDTEAWDQLTEDELRDAKNEILDLWEREKDTAPKRNESQLEERFIRPMFRKLGIPFEVEESTSRTQRRPDYAFFETDEAAKDAFNRREEGGDFYQNAVAVADAKRWGRPLDTRGSAEHERDFENPSYQIHVYLQETPTRWAVLTDGKRWRLYYGPTSHRLDSYYEVELPAILDSGDLDDFKYFYLFFRHEAFVEDASGDCFLDDVYGESNVFAQELGADLQDNIYEAIKILSEGFLQYAENDLSEDDLELIHDSSLIYLYRIIFVLYAEAEGRELLNTSNEIYEESYSLNSLKQEIADELDSADPKYRAWQTKLWTRLDDLFQLIDQGSKSRDIPKEDLYIPAYDGGLFRTDPDDSDSEAAQFLAQYQVGDAYLAEVIGLLTRSENGNGGSKIFVDYSSLDVRHLGSVYEGLLEYQLNIADEPLAIKDGEYVTTDDSSEVEVTEGEVYLTTDSGERKATGSYYTPEYVVEYIVENTLGPLVEEIREDLAGQSGFGEGGFAGEFAEEVFDLKILDPAMGSGHFLTSAVDYLAREIIDAQERQAAQEGIESVDEDQDINWARRQVAQKCIYGVDLNPLAVELAKVSLWLRTLAAEQPLAFLDHHLKTGNSLVGSDIEEVLDNGDPDGMAVDGQLTLHQSFTRTRRQALDHVTDRFQDLLAIDNETLDEIKEMESVFEEVRYDPLYQRLLAMADVHTANAFGLDVPGDAYERMAEALRDDSWEEIERQDWFESAQTMAAEERFFHWELEFPVAFYGDDGDRDSDAGFDAVIGNPPYVRVQKLDHDLIDYLKEQYQVAYRRIDISLMFFELASKLSRISGRCAYISSLQFRNSTYGKNLRTFLAGQDIQRIVDFGDLPVFADATTYAGIIVWKPTSQNNGNVQYVRVKALSDELTDILRSQSESDVIAKYQTALPEDEEWTFTSRKHEAVIDKLETHPRLPEFAESCTGMFTGRDEIFLFEPEEAEASPIEDEIFLDIIRGRDPERWHLPQASKKSIYPYQEVNGKTKLIPIEELRACYPNAYVYLISHKEQLAERKDSRQNIEGDDWYKLTRPGRIPIFNSRKIVTSGESKQNQFCIDDKGRGYSNARVFSVVPDEFSIEALLGVLNSKVAEFYIQSVSRIKRGGYYSYSCSYLDQLPIPKEINEELEELVTTICDRAAERNSLNLNLIDYLGNYTDGPKLPNIGLFQPTSTEILDATKEDYDNLRIGDLKTERDNSSVTIQATARYKPEDESEYETDQWGYTETDHIEAFTLTDLTGNEAALIEAFVPVAAEEAGGFANFRETATRTMSLLDRLKAITLPDPDDVEDDLRRYIEVKTRADELEEEIERTEKLIDKLVYEFYGLTEEEIDIIEAEL